MNDQPNLLTDLPDLVLENLLSLYCGRYYNRRNSLLTLTECNKFLKNYIETNPRLMRKLQLIVPTSYEDYLAIKKEGEEEDEKQRFEACLASKRKYSTVSFYYSSDTWVPYKEKDVPELKKKKALADLHSESIKKVRFLFKETNTDSKAVLHVLNYLEKLVNVEKVSTEFDNYGPKWKSYQRHYIQKPEGWNWTDYGDSYTFPHKFKNLKHLKMNTESPTVFNVFKSCENIETLEFIVFGREKLMKYHMLEDLLNNSRKTLKTLDVLFVHDDEESFDNLKEFFKAITNSGIDLKTFKMNYSSNSTSTSLLLDFLKLQKNLENLESYDSPKIFDKKFVGVMAGFSKLKNLKLTFCSDKSECRYYNNYFLNNVEASDVSNEENPNIRFLTSPWNLMELEELKLRFEGKEKYQLPYNLLQKTSDKLKKISFSGNFQLTDSFFERFSLNLGSLIELKIDDKCSDYSSNDIFWILKHLKKLETLKFVFPMESELNPDLFINNGNLILPAIKKVELTFNDSIEIDHALKILQFMSNMSQLRFKRWKNYSDDFLVPLTRQLSNLIVLDIDEYPRENIEYSVLLEVQSNIQKQHQFKICNCSIDYFMKNYAKNAPLKEEADDNEAGCSKTKKLKLT